VYILLPFKDSAANSQYAASLAASIEAFRFIDSSVPIPKIQDNDGGLSTGAILGISLGTVAAVFFVVLLGMKWKGACPRLLQISKDGMNTDESTPIHEPTSRSDDEHLNAARQVYGPQDHSIGYKDQGQTVPGESQRPVFAQAKLVSDVQ